MLEQSYIQASDVFSLFCRLNLCTKTELPIRSSEMGLLIYIVKSESPISSLQAAQFFKVSKPMIATMVRSLVSKGFLQKQFSTVDKRSYVLVPTVAAKDLIEQTSADYYKTMRILEENMGSKDFNQMLELLHRANTILLEEKTNG